MFVCLFFVNKMEIIIAFVCAVALLAFFIQKAAKYASKKLKTYDRNMKRRESEKTNPYILRHKVLKIDNDRNYNEYLEWCYANNQIPTGKEEFLKEVENKEKELDNLINGI